jgi:hypothetical protein
MEWLAKTATLTRALHGLLGRSIRRSTQIKTVISENAGCYAQLTAASVARAQIEKKQRVLLNNAG